MESTISLDGLAWRKISRNRLELDNIWQTKQENSLA